MAGELVSVLVATYQQVEFVDETLESIASQDYAAIQIVVADDGSTDGTAEKLAGWKERLGERLDVVRSERNSGITANFNRGLATCRGTYVALCGGDDMFLPGKISTQVAWFEKHPAGSLCAHDVEHFDSQSGRRLRLESSVRRQTAGSGPRDFIRGYTHVVGCSVMVRRASIPAYGFDQRLALASDHRFYIDVLRAGGWYEILPECLARYRRHDANVTLRRRDDVSREVELMLQHLAEENESLADDCRVGLARSRYHRGVRLLMEGDRTEARHVLLRSWRRLDPRSRSRLPVWLMLTALPNRLSAEAVRVLQLLSANQ